MEASETEINVCKRSINALKFIKKDNPSKFLEKFEACFIGSSQERVNDRKCLEMVQFINNQNAIELIPCLLHKDWNGFKMKFIQK